MDGGITWVHLLGLLATVMGIYGGFHRIWILPQQQQINKWRSGMEQRCKELEDRCKQSEDESSEMDKRMTLFEHQLESGNKKFDKMSEDISEIKETLHRLEMTFSKQIWKLWIQGNDDILLI